jgi:hypothetical protein
MIRHSRMLLAGIQVDAHYKRSGMTAGTTPAVPAFLANVAHYDF